MMTQRHPRLNGCDTCKHKKNPDGGHCYMFQAEPRNVCMQHTSRERYSDKALTRLLLDVYGIIKH